MAVHAQHLIEQQFVGQRIAPDQKRAQKMGDDESAFGFNWAKQAAETFTGLDFHIQGLDRAPPLKMLPFPLVELGINIQRVGNPVPWWESSAGS